MPDFNAGSGTKKKIFRLPMKSPVIAVTIKPEAVPAFFSGTDNHGVMTPSPVKTAL